ncbi:MAG TPA: hypothetical protein DER10_01770, partial [Elusimicrobia bacterium]|nr:hypothetical protein [Elusimicrobiota bacterium]
PTTAALREKREEAEPVMENYCGGEKEILISGEGRAGATKILQSNLPRLDIRIYGYTDIPKK